MKGFLLLVTSELASDWTGSGSALPCTLPFQICCSIRLVYKQPSMFCLVHTLSLKSGNFELLLWQVMKMFCHGSFSFKNCICDFFENMRKCETFHKGRLHRLVSLTLNVTVICHIVMLCTDWPKKSPCQLLPAVL